MATTVLVPDDYGLEVISALDGVRAVRYEPGDPYPPGPRTPRS
ncbi:hypothetical protein [Nocardia sp. NPDC050406]